MTNQRVLAIRSQREQKRSLFSARKLALMASVVPASALQGLRPAASFLATQRMHKPVTRCPVSPNRRASPI